MNLAAGTLACISCGVSLSGQLFDAGARERRCDSCGQPYRFEDSIVMWGRDVAPRRRSVSSMVRNQLNPLSSWLLPFRYFSDRRVEGYYRRTLDDEGLAERWAAHYLDLSLPSGALVLDHGCGRGRHAALLGHSGFQVCAQDVARHRWWHRLPQCVFQVVPPQITRLPWQSAVFSLVLDVEVVHHLDERELGALAAEVFRVLAPGGYWLLLEANDEGYGAFLPRRYYGRLHSLSEVRNLSEYVGFSALSVAYEGFYAPLVPNLINFFRQQAWPGDFDVADFGTHLEAITPARRRARWLLSLRKP